MPQLRQNYITGEWVVIAPERAKRPSDYVVPPEPPEDGHEPCRFCTNGSEYGQRLLEFETDVAYVLPNKYPAFLEDPDNCSPRSFGVEDGFYTARPSTGGHDLVVVKEHETNLTTFSDRSWAGMLDLIRRRVEYFYGVCNVMSAMPIYNYRRPAGASVRHPHAQIFASNVIPNMLIRELHHTERMYEQRGSCPFCDMIEHERTEQIRVLYDQDGFIAFTFYAARFPFEIWILPTTHQSNFERIDAEQVAQLGMAMQHVIGQLDRTLHDPPLNFFIHTLPSTMHTSAHFHWHVEIAPRVATYGGFEMGSGIVIDVTSPEIAAQALRE